MPRRCGGGDLAVQGFLALRDAVRVGDLQPLTAFFEAAVALKRGQSGDWRAIWRDGALAEAELTGRRLDEVGAGQTDLLRAARVATMAPAADHAGVGMCGRLDTYLPEGVVTLGAAPSESTTPNGKG